MGQDSEAPGSEGARSPRAQPRIGIVGAGAGGLSLARLLTDRGFTDVTVLEREERVGGKAWTVHHQGIGHELGACYSTYGYTIVRRWMEEYGIGAHRLPVHKVHLPGDKQEDFKEFVLGRHKLKSYLQMLRYLGHWARNFRRQTLGTQRKAFDAEVAVPFGRWLDERGLDAVKRFAWRSITAMGYGHLDEVPALYGLRWNTPSLLLSAAVLRVDEPVPGWMHLWEAMAWTLDVRFGTRILGVERKGGEHHLLTSAGPMVFDHLVISTALDEAEAWFPFDEEERVAFSGLHWGEYATTLVEVEGWFTEEDTWTWAKNLFGANGEARGHLMVVRRTGDKTPVAAARARSRPNVYVCYQYGDPTLDDAALQERLRGDIEADGGELRQIIAFRRWKYSPKLDGDAIRAGAVWQCEALQGRHNTWFTGASLSHEAVDNIVDFNVQLANKMEYELRGYEKLPLRAVGWRTRKRWEALFTINNK